MLYHNWVRNLSWYNKVVNSSLVEFISKVTLWITLAKNPANEKRRLHQMHLAKEISMSMKWKMLTESTWFLNILEWRKWVVKVWSTVIQRYYWITGFLEVLKSIRFNSPFLIGNLPFHDQFPLPVEGENLAFCIAL